MKLPLFPLLFLPAIAQADILSNFSPYLGSSSPDYDASDFSPESVDQDPVRAPFSPADSDFGVQEILGDATTAPKFHLFGSLDFNVTDNAPAAIAGQEDSSFYTTALIGGSWQPHIAAGWFADVGTSMEFFEFERPNALDFQNLNVHAGVVKTLVDLDDTVFYCRYEYQWLVTGRWSETDYSANRIRTGLQKVLFARSNQELAAGISAAFDIDANPERLERNEYAAELSYTWWFLENLGATLSWRGALWDFDSLGRRDWNHTAGLGIHWRTCPHSTLYANIYYSNNDSNTPLGVNDFEAWNAGIGVGLNYSF